MRSLVRVSGPQLCLLVLVSARSPVEEQNPRVGTFLRPGSEPLPGSAHRPRGFMLEQGLPHEPVRPEPPRDVRPLEALGEVR